jgi:hypothetical protein
MWPCTHCRVLPAWGIWSYWWTYQTINASHGHGLWQRQYQQCQGQQRQPRQFADELCLTRLLPPQAFDSVTWRSTTIRQQQEPLGPGVPAPEIHPIDTDRNGGGKLDLLRRPTRLGGTPGSPRGARHLLAGAEGPDSAVRGTFSTGGTMHAGDHPVTSLMRPAEYKARLNQPWTQWTAAEQLQFQLDARCVVPRWTVKERSTILAMVAENHRTYLGVKRAPALVDIQPPTGGNDEEADKSIILLLEFLDALAHAIRNTANTIPDVTPGHLRWLWEICLSTQCVQSWDRLAPYVASAPSLAALLRSALAACRFNLNNETRGYACLRRCRRVAHGREVDPARFVLRFRLLRKALFQWESGAGNDEFEQHSAELLLNMQLPGLLQRIHAATHQRRNNCLSFNETVDQVRSFLQLTLESTSNATETELKQRSRLLAFFHTVTLRAVVLGLSEGGNAVTGEQQEQAVARLFQHIWAPSHATTIARTNLIPDDLAKLDRMLSATPDRGFAYPGPGFLQSVASGAPLTVPGWMEEPEHADLPGDHSSDDEDAQGAYLGSVGQSSFNYAPTAPAASIPQLHAGTYANRGRQRPCGGQAVRGEAPAPAGPQGDNHPPDPRGRHAPSANSLRQDNPTKNARYPCWPLWMRRSSGISVMLLAHPIRSSVGAVAALKGGSETPCLMPGPTATRGVGDMHVKNVQKLASQSHPHAQLPATAGTCWRLPHSRKSSSLGAATRVAS